MTVLRIAQIYFALNAVLYGTIAIRTTLNPDTSAASVGAILTSPRVRAEYLTSHAGLLIALAAIFIIFAFSPDSHRLGLKASVAFYVPIILYRIVPPLIHRDRYAVAWTETSIEAGLLIAATVLLVLVAASPVKQG